MNNEEYHLRKIGDPPRINPKEAFRRLYDNFAIRLMAAYYQDGMTPRARNNDPKSKGKTRRGAVHLQGAVFKSVNLSGISPAEYRRRHLGAARKD